MELVELKKKERHAVFAICEYCFWTASIIDERYDPASCPFCPEKKLEFIPIAASESYRYSLSEKGNVEMCFSSLKVRS